jgi:hypothetical protein
MSEEIPNEVVEPVITEENFSQYFFDARNHKPEKGQVLACYSAAAEFAEGLEKRNLVELLARTNKAEAATAVMRKLHQAHPKDAVTVPRQIVEDLMSGMTEDEVVKKPYKFTFQAHFYTKPEYVPKDDPHWSLASLYHVDGKITVGEAEKSAGGSK